MIKSDIRKSLTTVDISQYDSVIETFSKRLEARNLAESTVFSYIGCLKIFFAWCVLYLASKAAMALDYEDFRAFIAFLEQDGLMPRTINVYIAALKQFRHFIQKESWSRYEITFKKYDRKLPRVPSTEQAGQLVDACSTNLEFLLIMLLLSTGMRISEVCALTYSDIERDDRQIYVHPGKGRSDRHVPLDDLVLEALIAYCKETIELCREAGEPIPTKDSPIFRFKDGIPEAFKRCFTQWTNQVHEKLSGEVISIDGKTVCGSKSEKRKPIHMISAWASEQEVVLGQMCVEEKTNEILTVPLLLELLDISGCIVTADAMSCQREITKKIIDDKGDYVLSLKENQPTLYEYAETYFKDAIDHPQWYPEMTSCETVDKGHGRIEKRTYYLSSDLSGLDNAADWSGLAGFGMVRSHVTVGAVVSSETRYAITSLKSVEQFSHAWRKHWGIENGLHYCLDVSFNEDHSRIRKDHVPDNLAVVRHFALSALKQLPEPKRASIKRKRKICAFDLDYLSSAVDLILL